LPVVDVVLIEDLQETLAGRQCNIVDEGEISLKQLLAVLDVENDATLVGSSHNHIAALSLHKVLSLLEKPVI